MQSSSQIITTNNSILCSIFEAAPTVTICDGALNRFYVLWRHRNHRCIIIIIINKPTSSFLQTGCPSCCPTNSVKALKGKYHIPWTCLPQTHLGSSTLSVTTNSSWLPWGGLPCLSSALWCQ